MISVIILSFNESKHIARALRSVSAFASEVFVVDSFSTDNTVELAKEHGAIVVQHQFENYAKQFQWALDNLPIKSGWIMRLDADEIVEEDLAACICRTVPHLPEDVVGINLKRKHVFLGRFIRHGGRYPLELLRIWRKGHGRIEQRWMDEHVVVWGGRVMSLDGGFSDHNLNDLTYFTDKHNKYATREAIDALVAKYGLLQIDGAVSSQATSRQAAIKRWLKDNLYNHLPFWLGPLAYFVFRYFAQLGFLDGREGLIYHFLQGFWYRFLVAAKVLEYERCLRICSSTDERRLRLEELTGYRLSH